MRQAAAVVSVGMYWLWQPTATSAGVVGSAAGGTSVLTEGGEGRGHIVVAAAQLVIRNVFF